MANKAMTEVTKEHLDSELRDIRKDILHMTRWVQGGVAVAIICFAAFGWQITEQNAEIRAISARSDASSARTDAMLQQLITMNGDIKSNTKAIECQSK